MVSTLVPMHSPFSQPPQKKQKMSLTQTYFLAHTARGKLSKEASRADHRLRMLVGHANLLDDLMLDLANAEQEQEQWFNRTVSGVKAAEEEQKPAKHIQWADTVVEEPEEDWQAEDADSSDSDSDDEEDMDEPFTATTIAITKSTVTTTTVTTRELTDEYDDDENSEELALTRTESHYPPELTSDSEEESDDDSMPPSPPSTSLEFTEKQRQGIATTRYYEKTPSPAHQLSSDEQSHFMEEGFYIPAREQPTMISAY